MDGFAVAKAIQDRPGLSGSTIMMLSSVGQRGDGFRCKELGVSAYLTKPIRQSLLLDAIHAALTLAQPTTSAKTQERSLVTRHSIRESHGALRVLLVEDNPVNRLLMISLLKKRGHHVVVAENGQEAVDAHASEEFDVVLMDVQMPEMDGFEATAAIRITETTTGKHLPIIALTAHAMTGDKERCLAAGMDGYLTKPVRPSELYDTMENLASPSALIPANQRVMTDALSPVQAPTPPPVIPTDDGPPFDPTEALARVADDRELLGQMIELFRAESPRMVSDMRRSIETGDAVALQRSAHAFKGSVGNFGNTTTMRLAQSLECMGRDNVLGGAQDDFGDLERHLVRLERDLTGFMKKAS
jgi:CheY-like chemotaxis protein